jgi:hypothetical protein
MNINDFCWLFDYNYNLFPPLPLVKLSSVSPLRAEYSKGQSRVLLINTRINIQTNFPLILTHFVLSFDGNNKPIIGGGEEGSVTEE